MARPSLFTHRKFIRLSRLLGAPYIAVGVLEFLWHHAYQDGDPRLGTAEDIEFVIGWNGEPGACASALVEVGFLDADGDQLVVHDLFDHAPNYAAGRRTKELERKKRKICEYCGAEYHSTELHSRFCCNACRVAHWRFEHGKTKTHGNADVTEGCVTETGGSVSVTHSNEPPAPAPAHNKKNSSCFPSKQRPSLPKKSDKAAVRRRAEDLGFAAFWDLWPNKKSRQDAEAAFVFDLDGADRGLPEDRTRDYLRRRKAAESAGAFVPNLALPATYIRGHRWEDSFDHPPPPSPPSLVDEWAANPSGDRGGS